MRLLHCREGRLCVLSSFSPPKGTQLSSPPIPDRMLPSRVKIRTLTILNNTIEIDTYYDHYPYIFLSVLLFFCVCTSKNEIYVYIYIYIFKVVEKKKMEATHKKKGKRATTRYFFPLHVLYVCLFICLRNTCTTPSQRSDRTNENKKKQTQAILLI